MGHNIYLVMVKCINITTSALCLRTIFNQHSDYYFIQLTFLLPFPRQTFRGNYIRNSYKKIQLIFVNSLRWLYKHLRLKYHSKLRPT